MVAATDRQLQIEEGAPDDEALEMQIQLARCQFLAARTPRQRRAAWQLLKALIESRSPEQVERLERERGLRR